MYYIFGDRLDNTALQENVCRQKAMAGRFDNIDICQTTLPEDIHLVVHLLPNRVGLNATRLILPRSDFAIRTLYLVQVEARPHATLTFAEKVWQELAATYIRYAVVYNRLMAHAAFFRDPLSPD